MAEQNLIAVAAGLARTGHDALRHHLRRLRHPARLRFRRHRLRPFQPQREDRRRPARPDHRLWRHASGDRGSGADAHDPGPRRHRSLRCDRDRGRRPRRSPIITARSTCGCCAAACRSCSIRGYRFEIGKARRLREGADVGIISTGFMTERALDAADALAKRGHLRRRAARADDQAVRCRRGRRLSPASVDHVVTAENHVVVGGLASLVVESAVRRRRRDAR